MKKNISKKSNKKVAKPIGRRVLILPNEPEKAETMTASGILLSGNQQVEQKFAVVIDVGSEVKFVKKDDVVFYGDYGNEELILNNIKYLLCTEDSLYCTIS